jgi:hypothetical protein
MPWSLPMKVMNAKLLLIRFSIMNGCDLSPLLPFAFRSRSVPIAEELPRSVKVHECDSL